MARTGITFSFAIVISILAIALPYANAGQDNPSPTPLKPYHLTYTASYNGWPITLHRTLKRNKDGYLLTTRASNFLGRIRESERFHLDEAGVIVPENYHYERNIFGKTRTETMDGDLTNGRSLSRRKGREYILDYTPGQLGPLSYQEVLAEDLRQGRERLCYSVINRGHIREYRFKRLGQETVETPLGRFTAEKVERLRDDDERETLIWFAKSLDYLPVKLVQREDGEQYEMTIESIDHDNVTTR